MYWRAGELQVGSHRVYMVREIAEGGFSKVYLVRDSSNASQVFALKQMLCQTKESIDAAHKELKALRVSAFCCLFHSKNAMSKRSIFSFSAIWGAPQYGATRRLCKHSAKKQEQTGEFVWL